MKTPSLAILTITSLVFLASCGGPPPTGDEVTIPGYGELREPIRGRDVSALEGRLIVLDPGRIRRTTLENMADTLPGGYLMSIPLRPREEAEMEEALRARLKELGYIK